MEARLLVGTGCLRENRQNSPDFLNYFQKFLVSLKEFFYVGRI